jgi:hypothetical protein
MTPRGTVLTQGWLLTLYPTNLGDVKQWLPLMDWKNPFVLDHVFLFLGRQDAPVHLAAVRRIACTSI